VLARGRTGDEQDRPKLMAKLSLQHKSLIQTVVAM